MAIHNALGKAGEDAVAAYLEHNGYVIRDRNWRKTVWNWTLLPPRATD